MLALLAAATVFGAPAVIPLDAATPQSAPAVSAQGPEHSLFQSRYDIVTRHPSACRAAGRLQTSTPAEPALLFRGPTTTTGPRRLIDMPRAEMCLLGGRDGGDGR